MARTKWTEARIKRLVKEGRGRGEGGSYRPWLQAQEVSSSGLASRHFCTKTGRQHDYLSKLELDFHAILAWHPDVVDINEQWPLPREVSRRVAAELNIKHPFYPGTHVETVMTLDFLVLRRCDGALAYVGYDTKCRDDLENPRTLEKLEIMRAALASKGIQHHIVCQDSLPRRKASHLHWIQKGEVLPDEKGPVPGFYEDNCQRMLSDIERAPRTARLNQYCEDFDRRFALPVGTGLRVSRILMGRRDVLPDFDQPSLENAPMATFRIREPEQLLMVAGDAA